MSAAERIRLPLSYCAATRASVPLSGYTAGSRASFFTLSPGPETIWLVGRISLELILKIPLELHIERDEFGDYVVSDNQMAVFGVGVDRTTAINDYTTSLIEYYQLIEDESEGHEPTAFLFRRLGRFIAKTSG